MSTRRLRDVIVEGGKRKNASDNWRAATRAERRSVREYYKHWDEDEPREPESRRAWVDWDDYRSFADKLNPLKRWLVSQAGRRWDDVYSELCAQADSRSLLGWHLQDHALGMVAMPSDPFRFRAPKLRGLVVDDNGMLQNCVDLPSWRRRSLHIVKAQVENLEAWLNSCLLIAVGKELFLYVETGAFNLGTSDYFIYGYRQWRKLSAKERKYWEQHDIKARKCVLATSQKHLTSLIARYPR